MCRLDKRRVAEDEGVDEPPMGIQRPRDLWKNQFEQPFDMLDPFLVGSDIASLAHTAGGDWLPVILAL